MTFYLIKWMLVKFFFDLKIESTIKKMDKLWVIPNYNIPPIL